MQQILKKCGSIKDAVCTREYANPTAKLLACVHFYLEYEQMYVPSQPQQPGIKQKEGVRDRVRGNGDLAISAAQWHTLGKGKQTFLACGQAGLSRVAWPGQGYSLEQDRKRWPAFDRCCSLFSTQKKTLQVQTRKALGERRPLSSILFPHMLDLNLWYSIYTVYMYRQ